IFVQLTALYVEGLIHISELGAEYFRFDEARNELRGERTGKRYGLGDRVLVQVSRVDLDGRKIDFRMVADPLRALGGGAPSGASSRRRGRVESVLAPLGAALDDSDNSVFELPVEREDRSVAQTKRVRAAATGGKRNAVTSERQHIKAATKAPAAKGSSKGSGKRSGTASKSVAPRKRSRTK
ncbi:MAG: S1 RNA-binding domain-containing protein, partial [Betaproteobacteria bacterium]|nr:S1 RNA-binding domain-containing protein [Betaproteobacteria bacterium]